MFNFDPKTLSHEIRVNHLRAVPNKTTVIKRILTQGFQKQRTLKGTIDRTWLFVVLPFDLFKQTSIMIRIWLFLILGVSVTQAEMLNQHVQIPSKILDRQHELWVYTPPSYDFDSQQTYPVLYLMDGAYNFNYVTGLIELWSNISPRFPEMIVVGISGHNSDNYRHLMKPPWDEHGQLSEGGGANNMIKALNEEIKPSIAKQFRTNELNILSGHSMGGLFTTYAALTQPKSFDFFIAISPSLWWQQETMKKVMAKKLSTNEPAVKLYVSLANEKGMGVHGFLEMVQTQRREALQLKFKHFPDESHGSVGLPTYEWALGHIFEPYQLKDRYFENGQAVINYSKQLKNTYGFELPINAAYLRNSCYALCRSAEQELKEVDQALAKHFPHDVTFFRVLVAKHLISENQFEQARLWIESAEKKSPDFVDMHHAWYLWYQAQGDQEKASMKLKNVYQSIESQHIRQWHINELNLPRK